MRAAFRLRAALALGALALGALAVLPASTSAQVEEQSDGAPLEIIHGFTLIDGTGGEALPDAALAVRGHTIVAVGTAAELRAQWANEVNAFEVDLGGGFVVPGLIDSHVHLGTVPNRERAEVELERLLYGGVTGVRDMAGDGRALASLARDARLGEIVAPDIYYAALGAGPSFCDDPRPRASAAGATPGAVPWLQAVAADSDLGETVALAAGTYAQGIKIYANLDAELVNRITYEAHQRDLRVWAHSMVFPARPLEVVRAGVDVVSHVCRLAWEGESDTPKEYHHDERPDFERMSVEAPVFTQLFEEMKARGTILDATLAMYARLDRAQARLAEGGDATPPRPQCDTEFARGLVRRAHELGVDIVAGTDFTADPSDPFPALHAELEELVDFGGLSPMEALVAATGNAARALGIDEAVGTLQVGKEADFVLLGADPTTDVRNLRTVREVWKRGRRFERDRYVPGVLRAGDGTGGALQTSSPQALLRSWVELWSRYDLDLLDELFLEDDRTTYFSSETAGLIVGFEPLVEHHRGFGFQPGGAEPSAELWIENAEFSDLGDAVVIGAVWFFGDPADRGSAQRGPMTAVVVATPDGYRIAHMHFANYDPDAPLSGER